MKRILKALAGSAVSLGMTYLGFVLNIVFFKVTWFIYFGFLVFFGIIYCASLFYFVVNNSCVKNTGIEDYNWFTFYIGLITNSLVFYIVYQTNPIIASFYLLTIIGFMFIVKIHREMLKEENISNKEKEN